MKKLLLFIAVWMCASVCTAQWNTMPFPANYQLNGILFLDDNTGFIGGSDWLDAGDIFKTTDAGQTWNSVLSGNFQPNKIAASMTGDTIAVGAYCGPGFCGIIYLSSDKGQSWDSWVFSETHNICDLYFKAGELFAVDIGGQLYRFHEGAMTVYPVFNDLLFGIAETNRGSFLNSQRNIYSYGHDTLKVIKTFDVMMNSQIVQDKNRLYTTIFDGKIRAGIASSLDGVIWNEEYIGVTGYIHALDFTEESMYAAGIYWRDDHSYSTVWQKRGEAWFEILSKPSNVPDYGFVGLFHTSKRLYAIGEKGKAYYINLDTTVGIQPSVNLFADGYVLTQNYPNPFNPNTKISFTIPKTGMTTLRIHDSVGREVTTLINSIQSAGEHEVNFNAANLATGVYYYTLKAGDFKQTKTMLLMK